MGLEVGVVGAGVMGLYTAGALLGRRTAAEPAERVDTVHFYDARVQQEEFEKRLAARELTDAPFTLEDTLEAAVRGADVIVVAVPTDQVPVVMKDTLSLAKPGSLVVDQTSRKKPAADAYDAFAQLHPSSGVEFASIHTLANPDASDPATQLFGLVRHASDTAYKRTQELFGHLSHHISEFDSINEHDTHMAHTQVNTARMYLAIASTFARASVFPWLEGGYKSPLDVAKFAMALRTASQKAHVYEHILVGNPHAKRLVGPAIQAAEDLYMMTVNGDEAGYQERIVRAKRNFFGADRKPVLSIDDFLFGNGEHMPNSHFSLMQYVVAAAENGLNMLSYQKAWTGNHVPLLVMADALFNTPELLAESMHAPFQSEELRQQDLGFYEELTAWSRAILRDSAGLYMQKHREMTGGISQAVGPEKRGEWLRIGQEIVGLSRRRMEEAMDTVEEALAA